MNIIINIGTTFILVQLQVVLLPVTLQGVIVVVNVSISIVDTTSKFLQFFFWIFFLIFSGFFGDLWGFFKRFLNQSVPNFQNRAHFCELVKMSQEVLCSNQN